MVTICGLGTHPPEETTLETLQALRECERVFCEAGDPAVLAWLRRHCPGARRAGSALAVVRAAARGRSVGLAVWGHPQLTSALARQVRARCRAQGVPCRSLAAVSPAGSAFARSASFLAPGYGVGGILTLALEDYLAAPGSVPAGQPLVLFAPGAAPARWSRLGALLSRRYPEAHPLTLFVPGGPGARVRASELARAAGPGSVLLVGAR